MQCIPCNSALLAKEMLFLTNKSTFLSKDFQKVCKSQQILILRQNSVCQGSRFSSESKLFGEGPSCLRTTSTTLRFNLALQLHFRGTLRNNLFCLNIFSTFPESCFHFSYLQKVLYPCYCYQLLEFVSSHVTMQIASVYICM